MVRIEPRKHHSNAICNVGGVEKMSPQGVGEENHLFKKSYEGRISRLEGVTWKNLDYDKISGRFTLHLFYITAPQRPLMFS